jgi:hypothetical protein
MKDLSHLSPEQKAVLAGQLRNSLRNVAQLARRDPNIFCQYVLKDERNGHAIRQAPMHHKWHELITAYPRLVLWSHVDGGKTNQIAIGRTLWELGRNPNLRVAIVSKTADLAKKIVRAVGQYVEKSAQLREVFPNLRPANDPSLPWTSFQLTVERSVRAKDASVQATGNYGNIHGSRIDLLILDDVLDHVNTRTPTPRESLWQWVRSTLFGRLTENARVIMIGNAWHPDDLLHRIEKEPRFVGYRFPVVSPSGVLTWPAQWPHKRIDEARQDMGPLEFSRALLCQARDDETARFKREFIDKGLVRGQGRRLVQSSVELYNDLALDGIAVNVEELQAAEAARRLGVLDSLGYAGIRFYTGVDLAVSKAQSADLTVLFTIAVFPNGDRRVLWIDSGRWSAPEILGKIRDTYTNFGSVFIVENNAAQQYIVDMVNAATAIPVRPFTTGAQKAHPEFGVESLAAEFAGGKWIIPCGPDGKTRSREIDAWLGELIGYDPQAHTGDRLMASWFAREGARADQPKQRGGVGIRIFGDDDD